MGLFDVMSSNNNSSNNKRPVSSSTTTSHHHVHDAGRSNRVSNSTTINNKIASGQTVDTRRFDDSYSTLQNSDPPLNQQQCEQDCKRKKNEAGNEINVLNPSKRFHDNIAYESNESLAHGGAGSSSLLNSIHSKHESIHLNKLEQTLSSSISKSIASRTQMKETAGNMITTGGSNGAYAIASSTTLLYITAPDTTKIKGQKALGSPRFNRLEENSEQRFANSSATTSSSLICDQSHKDFKSSDIMMSGHERLASATAAAVTTAAANIIDMNSFTHELSTIMENKRKDDPDLETRINQSEGFTFGPAANRTILTKTGCHSGFNPASHSQLASSNTNSMVSVMDEDVAAHVKLTRPSNQHRSGNNLTPFDIRVRRRRACQLKAVVVFLAMFVAACIGCLLTYYYIRFNYMNQRHFNLTQNMVYERASKMGSNKLEIIVPFESNLISLNDKQVVTNKVQEIVSSTLVAMNKSVESIELYELNEYWPNRYRALIDVEVNNAIEFTQVPLFVENGQIYVDESSHVLLTFRQLLRNTTSRLHLKPEFISLDIESVRIMFDQKSSIKQQQPFRLSSSTRSSTYYSEYVDTTPHRAKETTKKAAGRSRLKTKASTTLSTSTIETTTSERPPVKTETIQTPVQVDLESTTLTMKMSRLSNNRLVQTTESKIIEATTPLITTLLSTTTTTTPTSTTTVVESTTIVTSQSTQTSVVVTEPSSTSTESSTVSTTEPVSLVSVESSSTTSSIATSSIVSTSTTVLISSSSSTIQSTTSNEIINNGGEERLDQKTTTDHPADMHTSSKELVIDLILDGNGELNFKIGEMNSTTTTSDSTTTSTESTTTTATEPPASVTSIILTTIVSESTSSSHVVANAARNAAILMPVAPVAASDSNELDAILEIDGRESFERVFRNLHPN